MTTKLVALVAYICVTMSLGILVLMHGWGLEVKSWGWVLGVGIVGQFVIHTIGARIFKDLRDDDAD